MEKRRGYQISLRLSLLISLVSPSQTCGIMGQHLCCLKTNIRANNIAPKTASSSTLKMMVIKIMQVLFAIDERGPVKMQGIFYCSLHSSDEGGMGTIQCLAQFPSLLNLVFIVPRSTSASSYLDEVFCSQVERNSATLEVNFLNFIFLLYLSD